VRVFIITALALRAVLDGDTREKHPRYRSALGVRVVQLRRPVAVAQDPWGSFARPGSLALSFL
jgi:hypothetical protein